MNRRGDLPTILLFIVALTLYVATLFSFISFNWNFVEGSEGRADILSEIAFYEDYVNAQIKGIAKETIVEGGLIRENEGLKHRFIEIAEERNFGIEGIENYYGKILRGEFDFSRDDNKYWFEIKDLSLMAKRGANSIERKINLKIEFDYNGDVIGKTEEAKSYSVSSDEQINIKKSLSVGDKFCFYFFGNKHCLNFISINDDIAEFQLASEPINFVLVPSERIEFDLDKNGIDDLSISLLESDPENGRVNVKLDIERDIGTKFGREEEQDSQRELLLLFNTVSNEHRLSLEKLSDEIIDLLKTGEYSAVIIGETHIVKAERDAGAFLIEKISQIKKISFIEEQTGIGEGIFTELSVWKPGVIPREGVNLPVYKDLLNRLGINDKRLKDQYYPCPEIDPLINNLKEGEILITYTGSAHTSNDFYTFLENMHNKRNLKPIEDCIKEKGKKAIVVAMENFWPILTSNNQELFIREYVKDKREDISALDDYKGNWINKVNNIPSGQFFVKIRDGVYYGTDPEKAGKDYSADAVDLFYYVWKNDIIRKEILNEGFSLEYVELPGYRSSKKGFVQSVYFNDIRRRGYKIYMQKDNVGYKIVDREGWGGFTPYK